MLPLRARFLYLMMILSVSTLAAAQSADQQLPTQPSTQTPTQPSGGTPSKPQAKPLPTVKTNVNGIFETLQAKCFLVTFAKTGEGMRPASASLGWDVTTCPELQSGKLNPVFTDKVYNKDALDQLATNVDNNFQQVQQAVIDAITQVLADQSIKADQVAGVIKTSSDQITNEVTQRLQQKLADLVKAEVASQLKGAKTNKPDLKGQSQ
jgi:hypothetical protein